MDPRYDKPKILLIDMDVSVNKLLKSEGYHISEGSFGSPYKVEKSSKYYPVVVNGQLPSDYAEQDIIVINLLPKNSIDKLKTDKHLPRDKYDWWASGISGEVDPSPRYMSLVRDQFEKILQYGGVFIVFANSRYLQEIVFAKSGHLGLEIKDKIFEDNWSFLTVFASYNLKCDGEVGREITVEDQQIGAILKKHVKGASFLCTLEPNANSETLWVPLAKNKFGDMVSGMVTMPRLPGRILVFPDIPNKGDFILDMLVEVLPDLSPRLFPHVEKLGWVNRLEYEIPEISSVQNEIIRVKSDANRRTEELEKEISKKRGEISYMHDILTKTGAELVTAVKKSLEKLGFKKVINVDEESRKKGLKSGKNEDLQIQDDSPILLVEVKGIAGLPTDDDVLQVMKYLAPRMKEWGRTDVQGLSIVNHQRSLPPLERSNNSLFRDVIILNAQENKFGLLTTWDLYRLMRSFKKNNWTFDQIKHLFYNPGRIQPIPSRYSLMGVAKSSNPNGVTIKITGALSKNDRISIEFPSEFIEHDITSLKSEGKEINNAEKGMLVEILFNTEFLSEGLNIYKVERESRF